MHPTVMLTNGLRVANFSSPHPFTFVDGSVLPACSPEHAREMMLEAEEVENQGICCAASRAYTTDIELKFFMSTVVRTALLALANRCFDLTDKDRPDLVLVPLPVLQAVKAERHSAEKDVMLARIRCIRVADRVTKAIHIDRFCK
jgi:hypothetical protein